MGSQLNPSVEEVKTQEQRKNYSKPMLIEYGAVNDVTESLAAFADSLVALTVV